MNAEAKTPKPYTLDDALEDATVILDGAALGAMRSADLERQSAAARANPRKVLTFREDLATLTTTDQAVAESCYYSLPRGRRPIQGPSIRFAEMVVYAWTNLDTQTTIMNVDDKAAVVRARVVDLERNTVTEMEARRPVHKKKKNARPDEDDKQIAVAVANSIAYRNAVFRAVPRALWEPVYQQTLAAADGKGTMSQRRAKALERFAEYGATEAQVLVALARDGVEEISAADLRHLKGMYMAIRDGVITLEDAMRPPETDKRGPARTSESKLGAKLKAEAKPKSNKESPEDAAVDYDPETGEVIEDIPLDAEQATASE